MKLNVLARWLLIIVTTIPPALYAAKDRDWQTGKLIDIGHNARSESGTGLFIRNATTKIDEWTVTIDADGKRYVAEGDHYTGELGSHGFKGLHVLVNDPIRFVIEKDSLFVLDTDGKEYRLKIIKTVRKEE